MDPARAEAFRKVSEAIDALAGTSDLRGAVVSALEAEEAAYVLFAEAHFLSGRLPPLRGSEQEMVGSPLQALDVAVNQFGRPPRRLAEALAKAVIGEGLFAGGPLDLPADALPQRWVDTLVAMTQGTWPAKAEPKKPRRGVTAAGIR